MQSSNPVFRQAEGFNGRSTTYPASGMRYPAYGSQTAYDDPYTSAAGGPVTTRSARRKAADAARKRLESAGA